MRHALFLAAAFAAISTAASGADMPVKAPPPAPAAAWSGFYFGINVAGAQTKDSFDFVVVPGTGNLHPTGLMPGATVGVGSWLGGNLYVGVEADGAYDFLKTDNTCVLLMDCRIRSSFFLTQRAIVGVPLATITGAVQSRTNSQLLGSTGAVVPANLAAAQILPYLTAGVAERRIEACVFDPLGVSQGCEREWLVGFAYGAGVRIPLSQNVSFDVSYLRVNYKKNFVPNAAVAIFPATFNAESEQMIRLGANFHF